MEIPIFSEQQRFEPNFYFKTHNSVAYQSQDPRDVAALMKTSKNRGSLSTCSAPGACNRGKALDPAFRNGADFS
jgi:hypothetical protein